jgi:hypothetical protein
MPCVMASISLTSYEDVSTKTLNAAYICSNPRGLVIANLEQLSHMISAAGV